MFGSIHSGVLDVLKMLKYTLSEELTLSHLSRSIAAHRIAIGTKVRALFECRPHGRTALPHFRLEHTGCIYLQQHCIRFRLHLLIQLDQSLPQTARYNTSKRGLPITPVAKHLLVRLLWPYRLKGNASRCSTLSR